MIVREGTLFQPLLYLRKWTSDRFDSLYRVSLTSVLFISLEDSSFFGRVLCGMYLSIIILTPNLAMMHWCHRQRWHCWCQSVIGDHLRDQSLHDCIANAYYGVIFYIYMQRSIVELATLMATQKSQKHTNRLLVYLQFPVMTSNNTKCII